MTYISTLVDKLDKMIGGWKLGKLYHIYGDGKVGKTTLSCYLATISLYKYLHANKKLSDKTKFIVISCDAGIEEERWKQLCEVYGLSFDELMRYVEIYVPMSFDELYDLVMKKIHLEMLKGDKVIKYITIDPITLFYREEFSKGEPKDTLLIARKYSPKLQSMLQQLERIAYKFSGLAFAINLKKQFLGFGREEGTRFDWYGGYAFEYLPYSTILMEKLPDQPDVVKVTLKLHRSKPVQRYTVLKLTDRGFE